MLPPSTGAMTQHFDIVAYSADHRRVLVVECKGGKMTSPENAAQFRRNLMAHSAITPTPYFLLAFPTSLFLWKAETAPGELADFTAPAKPVLRSYLGSLVDREPGLQGQSIELAMLSWLGDLAAAIRKPDPKSEADQMVVKSGLYDKIRRGEVKSEVSQ
jgi:hypothetical protein